MLAGGLAPIRYITDGATTGGVRLDHYGRGEQHDGEPGHPSVSNSDPCLPGPSYVEPTYDPFWFCHTPPHWENIQCVPAPDGRSEVARSVGMIVSIHGDHVSTSSVTLIGPDLVITAGHCLPNPALEVPTSSVTFDYQVNCDGAKPMGYNARFFKVKKSVKFRNQTVSGSYHDYCLLQLQAPPGACVATWTLRAAVPAPVCSTVSGAPGTEVILPLMDNGEGSYRFPGIWDPSAGQSPGVVIGQPGRPLVVVFEPHADGRKDGSKWMTLCWIFFFLMLVLLFLWLFK